MQRSFSNGQNNDRQTGGLSDGRHGPNFEKNMNTLKLIQSEVCPYAQRTHMCLLEKSLDFDIVEVDLADKPAWFEEISPYGKVPVLEDGEIRIYESSVINEYLDEVYRHPPLMPSSASARAVARIWIDFDNVRFVPAFYRVLLEQDLPRQQKIVDQLVDHMKYMEEAGFASHWKGPYWFNGDISLVDLTLYPHFERMAVLETYRNISIPPACHKLMEWCAAMKERPSARFTAHDDDYHIESYRHYADGTASGTTARDMRQ